MTEKRAILNARYGFLHACYGDLIRSLKLDFGSFSLIMVRVEPVYRINPELKEFLESGVACLVGTGDASGRPHLIHGWGPRVGSDASTVDVFLDTLRAERTLANLTKNAGIAMTVAHPVSYRSVQLKGLFHSTGDPTTEDLAWVRHHRDEFLVSTTLVGDPAETICNLWLEEIVRVSFSVERAFDQTPGPGAGKPI